MEQEKIVRKVKIGARILRVSAQISFWALIAAGGLSLIFCILMKAFPEAFSQGPLSSLAQGVISSNRDRLTIDLTGHTVRETLLVVETFLLGFIASCVMGALFLRQLTALLRRAESGRPFSPDSAKNLVSMGVILIVSCLAIKVGEQVMLRTIMQITGLSDVSIHFASDSDMILAGILLFVLAGIFKYGKYLQDEYDATV